MNQQIIESLLNRITALEKRQAEMTLNAVQPRHNLAAGAAPLVTDDITLGYSAGSVWIFGADIYICSSGAAGAAVWDIVNGGSGFGGDVDDLTTNTGVAGQMVRVAALGGLEYRSTSQVRTDIGATTIGGNVFTSTNPSAISFARANADNTFSWLNSSDFVTALSLDSSYLRLNAANSPVTGVLDFQRTVSHTGTTNEVKQIIRGGVGQTANLTVWQSSSGTVLSSMSENGLSISPASTTDATVRLLNVQRTYVTTTGSPVANVFAPTWNPLATYVGTFTGFQLAATKQGSTAITSASSYLTGAIFSGGTSTSATGNFFKTRGGWFISSHGQASGALTHMVAAEYLVNNSSTGTVTNAYGNLIAAGLNTSGTITNLYGIKIENQSAGINNYAIYTDLGLVRFGDNVGIGLNPTAKMHISAGTATAGTAPLKLTAGTNLTTPEDGAFEFDGTDLFFTTGGVRRTVTLV